MAVEVAVHPAGEDDTWERRQRAMIRALPYFSLAIGDLVAWLQPLTPDQGGLRYQLVTLALVGLTAGWVLWMITLHPQWQQRAGLMALYYLGLLACMTALIWRNPWFAVLSTVGYVHAFLLPWRRWALAGVAAIAILTATAQRGGIPLGLPHAGLSDVSSYLAVVLLNTSLAGAFSFFGIMLNGVNARRKQAITDLAEANRQLSATLAENAGLHRQLLTQAREAGTLDERARMAREIHDTIAQALTAIITQLEAADQVRDRPDERQRHLDTVARLARESLAEARRSVQALRPSPLEHAGLPEALADVAARWSTVHGVTAEVTTTGTVQEMHPEIEGTLVRTAQEALANVAKHAGASRVGLTLSYMDDVVTLDVRDDGAGFDPAVARSNGEHGGFGLTAMHQRLQRIAGLLEIESEPGGGTAISARVPAVPAGVSRGTA